MTSRKAPDAGSTTSTWASWSRRGTPAPKIACAPVRGRGANPKPGRLRSKAQARRASQYADWRDFSTPPVEILIEPIGRGRYQVQHGGRVIVRSTSEPLLAAARALLAEGVAPDTRIAMRHAGSDHGALTSTVGTAARLTVKERPNGPRFVRWTARETGPDRPPVRFSEDPALDTGSVAPKRLLVGGGK